MWQPVAPQGGHRPEPEVSQHFTDFLFGGPGPFFWYCWRVIPARLSPRAPVMTRCWNIWPLHRFVREQQRDETPLCRGSPAMFNGNLLLPRGFCLRLQKCVLSRTGRTSKCSRSQLKPGPLRWNASGQHKMVREDKSAHAGFTWHLV